MKKKRPAKRAFALSACWILPVLFGNLLSAQEEPPDAEENEAPFSVVYRVLPEFADRPHTLGYYAYAINEEGKVVGCGIEEGREEFPPGVLWWPIEGPEGYWPTYAGGPAYDINDDGAVVPGWEFLTGYDLPDAPNPGTYLEALGYGINNQRQIVGSATESYSFFTEGSGPQNTWNESVYTSYPCRIGESLISQIENSEKTKLQVKDYHDGTHKEIRSSPVNGTAWSIDEQGYCVGVDSAGTAVWHHNGGYRKVPEGAQKRLTSISKEGLVCGMSGGAPTIWLGHGEDEAIVLPLPENVGGGDNFATAASDTGWVIGQVGGLIRENIDREWKGGDAYAWKEGGEDKDGKPVWIKMNLSKNLPKGWNSLTLFDVNRLGQAVGFASVNGKYTAVLVELGPQLIAIDANRDGVTRFEDDPEIVEDPKLSDLTSEKRPFRFWVNDDQDTPSNEEIIEVGDNANFTDDEINGVRDLEDFYRLKVRLLPGWKEKFKTGYTLKIRTIGNLKVKLFKLVPLKKGDANENNYLSKMKTAQEQLEKSYVNAINSLKLHKHVTDKDFEKGEAIFLWEAERVGNGLVTISLTNPSGRVEMESQIYLDLHRINHFFERAEAYSEERFVPPYKTLDGYVPEINYKIDHKEKLGRTEAEEDKEAIVFVHGWRMGEKEATNWGQMMYKRLWHAGFKGRYFFFRWFTYSSDNSSWPFGDYFTYNKSEHRAWETGRVLKDYLDAKRKEIPAGYSLNLSAHSMGNIIAGEAIKRGAPVNRYVMLQAAVSASSYDTREEIKLPLLTALEKGFVNTPQFEEDMGYRGYFERNKVPTYNFYNEKDPALFSYLGDQAGFKADPTEIRGGGHYEFINDVAGIYKGGRTNRLIRELTNPYESMAFLARSLTRATGAEPQTSKKNNGVYFGVIKGGVDLRRKFGLGSDSTEHSAQFNRSIQDNMFMLYKDLLFTLTGEKRK